MTEALFFRLPAQHQCADADPQGGHPPEGLAPLHGGSGRGRVAQGRPHRSYGKPAPQHLSTHLSTPLSTVSPYGAPCLPVRSARFPTGALCLTARAAPPPLHPPSPSPLPPPPIPQAISTPRPRRQPFQPAAPPYRLRPTDAPLLPT